MKIKNPSPVKIMICKEKRGGRETEKGEERVRSDEGIKDRGAEKTATVS